jgi:hypothetical protein
MKTNPGRLPLYWPDVQTLGGILHLWCYRVQGSTSRKSTQNIAFYIYAEKRGIQAVDVECQEDQGGWKTRRKSRG